MVFRTEDHSCAHRKKVKSFCFLSFTLLHFMYFITKSIFHLFTILTGFAPLNNQLHKTRVLCFFFFPCYIPASWTVPVSYESMKNYLLSQCLHEWISNSNFSKALLTFSVWLPDSVYQLEGNCALRRAYLKLIYHSVSVHVTRAKWHLMFLNNEFADWGKLWGEIEKHQIKSISWRII